MDTRAIKRGIYTSLAALGVGTVLVAVSFAKLFPELRRVDSLDAEELQANRKGVD